MNRLFLVFLVLLSGAQAQDAKEIVRRGLESMQKQDRVREEYTYKEAETERSLNVDGSVSTTHTTVKQILYFGGERVEQILAKDGKPLPAKDAKREQEKLDKAAQEASKLTASERQANEEKRQRSIAKKNSWLLYVPDAYNFTRLPDQQLNGRAVYVIRADPKPSYNGKESALFHKVKGTLYIDKEFYTVAHLEAEFLDSYSIGLFLAKIEKGTRMSFEQIRVNQEVWLPKRVTFYGQARALTKTFRREGEIAYSDYQKFRTESRVVSTGQP